MDFYCLSFTSGWNIQLQAKIGKIASQKEKKYDCPKFENRPPFAPLQVFAPQLTKIAPRGAIRPTLGNPAVISTAILTYKIICFNVCNSFSFFKECTAAPISNGAIVTSTDVKVDHGTNVEYSCETDYSTTDSLTVTCNDGSMTPPTCYKGNEALDINLFVFMTDFWIT